MRRHNDGGQFTALARGSARAGARETRRLRNSLDGGGRHDVCTHHKVRQLIPQRGPTIRPGPSSHPHRPGSPSTPSPASRRPNHFRLDTVRDAGAVRVVCRVRGRPEIAVMPPGITITGQGTTLSPARPQPRSWAGPTVSSSPRSPDYSPSLDASGCSPHRRRSCAGTASSSPAAISSVGRGSGIAGTPRRTFACGRSARVRSPSGGSRRCGEGP